MKEDAAPRLFCRQPWLIQRRLRLRVYGLSLSEWTAHPPLLLREVGLGVWGWGWAYSALWCAVEG